MKKILSAVITAVFIGCFFAGDYSFAAGKKNSDIYSAQAEEVKALTFTSTENEQTLQIKYVGKSVEALMEYYSINSEGEEEQIENAVKNKIMGTKSGERVL